MNASSSNNDPLTYFDMFLHDTASVKTGWENDKYEELIQKTRTTSNQEERKKL